MMKIIYLIAGSILAVVFLLVIVKIDSAFNISPKFPAYAGEEDFQIRFEWFLMLVVPGFMLIGAWIGILMVNDYKALFFGFGGVLFGTIISFAILYCLSPIVESLENRNTANNGVILFYILWLLMSGIGVLVAKNMLRKLIP